MTKDEAKNAFENFVDQLQICIGLAEQIYLFTGKYDLQGFAKHCELCVRRFKDKVEQHDKE